MTGSEFAAEAVRLARPCTLLKGTGPRNAFAGVWGGDGVVPAPDGPYRHWLSVDCRFLPAGLGPAAGCLSVYADEQDGESGAVSYSPAAGLPWSEGRALFARPARSLPPMDAVFRYGGEEVQQWLASLGWDAEWGYNGNFPEDEPCAEYERLYQSECPLYAGGASAVLGGWHFPWPDGDWAELVGRPLLVWTFDESEPWVETWGGPEGYRVVQRVT